MQRPKLPPTSEHETIGRRYEWDAAAKRHSVRTRTFKWTHNASIFLCAVRDTSGSTKCIVLLHLITSLELYTSDIDHRATPLANAPNIGDGKCGGTQAASTLRRGDELQQRPPPPSSRPHHHCSLVAPARPHPVVPTTLPGKHRRRLPPQSCPQPSSRSRLRPPPLRESSLRNWQETRGRAVG